MTTLEMLAKKGKLNLRREGWQALLHDYDAFKNNSIIHLLIVAEMMRRTGKRWTVKVGEDWHCETYISFHQDGWDLWPRYKEAPAVINAQHERNNRAYFERNLLELIDGLESKERCKAMVYIIAGRIRELKKKLAGIRKEVKERPERRSELWSEYKETQEVLEHLSPYDVDLNIGILGKPFFAGFADQG